MKSYFLSLSVVCVGLLFLLDGPRRHSIQNPVSVPVTRLKPHQIPIDGQRWYQVVNAQHGLDGLFDGITDQAVHTGYNKLLKNYDAYYPLREGETIRIDSIRLYDYTDTNTDAPLTLSIITADWKRIPIARFVGDKYKEWVGPDPARPNTFALPRPVTGARYLLLNTSGAYPSELELYGAYTPGKLPTKASVRTGTPFRQAIGVNMFEWNMEEAARSWEIDESRVPAIRCFGAVRHYMDWEKLEAQPGQYTFNLTLSGAWNYDALYERLHREGVEVLACLKTIPKWMENTYPAGQRDYGNNPAPYGRDLGQPQSYIEQARVGFQYIARYGSNKRVDPALVKISTVKTWMPPNEKKIGLGLIRYIECENERDRTWGGRQGYQTAREYAANLSAFYDGHKKTLGPGVGVKNADPTVTVVMGGLASPTLDYLRAMVDWCREHRGYRPDGRVDLCWDVINYHLYANDARSSQGGGGTRGAAPEVSGVGEQAAAFVQLAHELAYDMPVWITETGYDTHPGSPFHAIPVGTKSVLQTQADWILRTSLLFTRVGVARTFFYQLYDDNPDNPTQFSSMGLINGDKTRKPAADYLAQALRLMGNYEYRQTLSRYPVVADRYEYRGQTSYVLVVPDERARTATYTLSVQPGDTVRVCTPVAGRETMPCTSRVATSGQLTLTVTERPTFVMLGKPATAFRAQNPQPKTSAPR
ncbi:hypothetical protein [Rudanella lutea]|uniref:hypothetical protein n=1 Tax=Rudanella lutea TaxID=451374 RepID=UPI0005C59CA3|nr:hypothetical protein [Rudanella lutea]